MRLSVVSCDDDVDATHFLVKVKPGKDFGPNLVCNFLQTHVLFLNNSIIGPCAHANGSKLCCTCRAVFGRLLANAVVT